MTDNIVNIEDILSLPSRVQEVSDMDSIDTFLSDMDETLATLKVAFTKEDLQKLKLAFKVMSGTEFVQFKVKETGDIKVSAIEQGVYIWVDLKTLQCDLYGQPQQVFYLDVARLTRLADACLNEIVFEIDNGELKANVGHTTLSMSLPLEEADLDPTEFVEPKDGKTDSLSSAHVKTLVSRCYSSRNAVSFYMPTMRLADTWTFATVQSATVVKYGFKSDLEVHCAPTFMRFIENLTANEGDIYFTANESQFCVSSSTIHYKIALDPNESLQTLSHFYKEPTLGTLKYNVESTVQTLSLMEIPLVGMNNAVFHMEHNGQEDEPLVITAKDIGGRQSKDTCPVTHVDQAFDVTLSIDSYLNMLKPMTQESVTVQVKESSLIFSDSVQETILLKYI